MEASGQEPEVSGRGPVDSESLTSSTQNPPDSKKILIILATSPILPWCHCCEDPFGVHADLFYMRDREKRNMVFLIVREKHPWLLLECNVTFERSLPV